MVNGKEKEKTRDESKNDQELAIIPIGIPIAFGTGLFTTIIIFKNQSSTLIDLISVSSAFCLNALIFYIVLKNSIYIRKYLGITGQNIITKLMGLIVGAIAVQFIVSGIVHLTNSYL
jgi:multiple antibiotic resistance protein